MRRALAVGLVVAVVVAQGAVSTALFVPTALGDEPEPPPKLTKEECAKSYEDAQIHQQANELIEAKAQFLRCNSEECPEIVRDECGKAPDFDKIIPSLVFDAVDENGAQVIHTKVSVDGRPASDSIDGHALSFNPGKHTVRFETAGKDPVEVEVVLLEGEQRRAVKGEFKAKGVVVAPVVVVDEGARFGPVPWIVAGSGLAVAATGTGLLISGLMDVSEAEDQCPNRVCMDQESVNIGDAGIAKATAGKVLLPIGLIVLGTGLVWQFVFNGPRKKDAPKPAALEWQIVPAPGGAFVLGSF